MQGSQLVTKQQNDLWTSVKTLLSLKRSFRNLKRSCFLSSLYPFMISWTSTISLWFCQGKFSVPSKWLDGAIYNTFIGMAENTGELSENCSEKKKGLETENIKVQHGPFLAPERPAIILRRYNQSVQVAFFLLNCLLLVCAQTVP